MNAAQSVSTSVPSSIFDVACIRPWDRLPNEKGIWYKHFVIYRDMGITRSVPKAFKEALRVENPEVAEERLTQTVGGIWYQMAREWSWEQRAIAWDKSEQMIMDRERRAEKLRREREMRAQEWQQRQDLIDKANQMLKTPVHLVRTVDDEGKVLEIKPAKWTFKTIVDYFQMAAQLGRMSLELDENTMSELKAIEVLAKSEILPAHAAEIVSEGLDEIVERLRAENTRISQMAQATEAQEILNETATTVSDRTNVADVSDRKENPDNDQTVAASNSDIDTQSTNTIDVAAESEGDEFDEFNIEFIDDEDDEEED